MNFQMCKPNSSNTKMIRNRNISNKSLLQVRATVQCPTYGHHSDEGKEIKKRVTLRLHLSIFINLITIYSFLCLQFSITTVR